MITFAVQDIYDNIKRITDPHEFKKNDIINFLRKILHLHNNITDIIEKNAGESNEYQNIRFRYLISV